jgi:hypothetical protein
MKVKPVLLFIGLLWATSMAQRVAAAPFDHSALDRTLKTYVDARGLVDYNGIARDATFKGYMSSLRTAEPETMSRDARLAFWINAYNAVVIDKVTRWKPKKSVRETLVPGLWTSTRFFTSREHVVAGKKLSPDDIENEILRKQLGEPRIHFAIICASLSCPELPQFAYTEENVQAKLDAETRDYLNSERGTRMDAAGKTLYISKIFDWFAGDFEAESGSVLKFIKPYLDPPKQEFLQQDPKISYLPYDWGLNAQKPLD